MPAQSKTDTLPVAAIAQAEALRRLAPERRLELAIDMSLMVRALLFARLRTEHPGWSVHEVNRELLRLTLPGGVLPRHSDDSG